MASLKYHDEFPGVLPAAVSKSFNRLFKPYAMWLYRRRFDAVYYKGDYRPGSLDSTVWYMNHYSWWDALTPFLLNELIHRQNLRAIMDEVQVRNYPFFRKLGAFSVDRTNPRKAVQSLRYAADCLTHDRTGLYIFPQGAIRPEMERPIKFESGLAWLYQSCPSIDFVPIVTTMNTRYSDRPRLFIRSGIPIKKSTNDRDQLTNVLSQALEALMDDLHITAEEEHPLWNRLL
jgi:1-acyl-sn-glycerol-3-phosphate acyltransferase